MELNFNIKSVVENSLEYSLFDPRLKAINILPPNSAVKVKWGQISLKIDPAVYKYFDDSFLENTKLFLDDFRKVFEVPNNKPLKFSINEMHRYSYQDIFLKSLVLLYCLGINLADIKLQTGGDLGILPAFLASILFKLTCSQQISNDGLGGKASGYFKRIEVLSNLPSDIGRFCLIHEFIHGISMQWKLGSTLNWFMPNAFSAFFYLYYLDSAEMQYFNSTGNPETDGIALLLSEGKQSFLEESIWNWKDFHASVKDWSPDQYKKVNVENYGIQTIIAGSVFAMKEQGYPKEIVFEYLKDIASQGICDKKTDKNLLLAHQNKARKAFKAWQNR